MSCDRQAGLAERLVPPAFILAVSQSELMSRNNSTTTIQEFKLHAGGNAARH
jgi:hypothetical protein